MKKFIKALMALNQFLFKYNFLKCTGQERLNDTNLPFCCSRE